METFLLAFTAIWLWLGVMTLVRHHLRTVRVAETFVRLKKEHQDSVGIDSSARAYAAMLAFYDENETLLSIAAFRMEHPVIYWLRTSFLCILFGVPIMAVSVLSVFRRP